MVTERCTIREVAKYFGISKSTAYLDMTVRLKKVNMALYEEVREVLDFNKAVRHLRGGEATRKKYKQSRRVS